MKKVLVLLLTLTLVFCMFACGDKEQQAGNEGWQVPSSFTFQASADVGSGFDTSARAFAKGFADTGIVTQPIKITNVAGGAGAVGFAQFGKNEVGKDDILCAISGGSSTASIINQWEFTPTDFTPVAIMIKDFSACATAPDNPKTTDLATVVAAMQKDPTSVVWGGSAPPDLDYLANVMFFNEIGVDVAKVEYVTYDDGGELIPALMGHHIDCAFSGVGEYGQYVESNTLKILGVASMNRLGGTYANCPTFAEQGYSFEMCAYRGMAGPVDMPQEALEWWQDKFEQLAKTKEFQDICAGYSWTVDCVTDGIDKYLADYRDNCLDAMRSAGVY